MLITKKEGLEDLLESAKRHDIDFEIDSNSNITVY